MFISSARRKDSKQAKKSSEIDLEEGNVGSRVDSTDWNSDTDEGKLLLMLHLRASGLQELHYILFQDHKQQSITI